jgi:hypothetical protein
MEQGVVHHGESGSWRSAPHQLGGSSDREGDGPGGRAPPRAGHPKGCEADGGRGGPFFLQAADAADPGLGAECRVARMMQGVIRDRGCPKAHGLKRLTDPISLFSAELFCLMLYFCFGWPSHPLGCCMV